MKKIKVIFITSCLVLISSIAYSQDTSNKIKVTLNISADNIVQSRLHSLIERQLRNFKDVKIVNQDKADYEIKVQEMSASIGNRKVGYITSLLVLKLFSIENVVRAIKNEYLNRKIAKENISSLKKKNELRKNLNNSLIGKIFKENLVISKGFVTAIIEYQTLYTDDKLERLAKNVVADVDYHVFDSIRDRK